MTNAFQDSESIGVGLQMQGPVGHLGCGYWSEDRNDWRTDGIVLGSIGMELGEKAAFVECDTFHLSAFTSRQDSTTPQWTTSDLLTGFSISGEVGRGVRLWHANWNVVDRTKALQGLHSSLCG